MKKWLIMLLVTMLALGGLLTGAAAEEEKDLFTHSPFVEVKDKLKPVGLSSEDQGIRMTVDSALVRDDKLWISYDLQDLEGSRIDEHLFANCSYQWIDYHMETKDKSYSVGTFGETKDHGSMIQYVEAEQLKDDDTLSVSMQRFPAIKKYRIPLLPLLEKYGEEEPASIEISSIVTRGFRSFGGSNRVLDFNQSLDIPLNDDPETKNVLLSGIGWIDGHLHVQFHLVENEDLKTDPFMDLDRWNVDLRYYYGDIGDYSKISAVNNHKMWNMDDDGAMDWTDIIVDCEREDLEKLEKYYIELTCVQEVLEGNWEFSITLEPIRATDVEKTKGTVYEHGFSEPLVEIDYGYEDQGIRVSAVAARVTDDEFMVVYDLQDLEGQRIDSNLAWVMHYLTKYNLSINKEGRWHVGEDVFDSKRNHGQVINGFHYDKLESDDTLTITLDSIPVFERKSIEVLPLLEEYGQDSEGCYVEHFRSGTTSGVDSPEKQIVLDYTHSLDIPLGEEGELKDILLSGIGWIDGKLHIQLHYIDHDEKSASLGDGADDIWDCYLRNHAKDGVNSIIGAYMKWDDDGDRIRDYAEYIIDCKPHDPLLENLFLDMAYVREIVKGNWEINIPLDEIR